jgi:hypothetical protein
MAINLSRKRTLNSFFHDYRREVMIGFCAFLALIASLIFPKTFYGDSFWLSFFFLFLFPILSVKFLLKEPLSDFGFSKGDSKWGLVFSATFIVLFVFLNYYIVSRPELRNQLSIAPWIAKSFWSFILFQAFITLPLHFFWDFFFRGFLQLGLESKLGKYSFFLQAILQSLLFFKGTWLMIFLVFISALAAGAIVRWSRSIFY